MTVDAGMVDLFYDGRTEYFSYVKGQLIVRHDEDLLRALREENPDHDLVIADTVVVGDVELALVTGFPTFEGTVEEARDQTDPDRRHPEIAIARQRPYDVEPNHVMYAHHVHPSQEPHLGRIGPLTADWVTRLPVTTTFVNDPDSYSGMRASPLHLNPLHLNPLHLNPLHLNPLHMNPLHLNPLHLNPLHMNGLVSTAIPTTPRRRSEKDPSVLPAPPSEFPGPAKVAVYIIDSGLGEDQGQNPTDFTSRVLPNYGSIGAMSEYEDAPDRWGPWADTPPTWFVDPIAGHGTFIGGIYGQLLHAKGVKPEITVTQEMNPQGMIDEFSVVTRITAILAAHPSAMPGVLNLSFGGTAADFAVGGLSALKQAIDVASATLVVVASAGNVSTDKEHYPAAFNNVIGVGALDANGVAWFSNFSNEGNEWVNCWAEGVDIISPFLRLIAQWRSQLSHYGGNRMRNERILGTRFKGFLDDPPNDHFDGVPANSELEKHWVAWSGTSFAAPIVGARAAELLVSNNNPGAVRTTVVGEFQKTKL